MADEHETKTTHLKVAPVVSEDQGDDELVGDVSLEAYLKQDDSDIVGKVRVRGGNLSIASVTEDELDRIQQAADKPNVKAGRGATKFDPGLFKRLLASKSLSKASGGRVSEGEILRQLGNKLSGDVTTIAEAVIKLSGFDENRSAELDELVGFSR